MGTLNGIGFFNKLHSYQHISNVTHENTEHMKGFLNLFHSQLNLIIVSYLNMH